MLEQTGFVDYGKLQESPRETRNLSMTHFKARRKGLPGEAATATRVDHSTRGELGTARNLRTKRVRLAKNKSDSQSRTRATDVGHQSALKSGGRYTRV
jgi:hypothetical protein